MKATQQHSCGQFDPQHSTHPIAKLLTSFGWRYSHSTTITRLDKSKYTLHTWKLGDWNIGCANDSKLVAFSKCTSKRQTVVEIRTKQFDCYLLKKTNEIKKQLPTNSKSTKTLLECMSTNSITVIEALTIAEKIDPDFTYKVATPIIGGWQLDDAKITKLGRNGYCFNNTVGKITDLCKYDNFEIRCGNGNDGCYRLGTIQAKDAFYALIKASRIGLFNKPKDCKIAYIDGDDQHASWCSYVAPIYGDACRWIAEANLID